jgi:hypothetical protein
MVKASLRKSGPVATVHVAPPAETGEVVQRTTVAGKDLTSIIPDGGIEAQTVQAEPLDNIHIETDAKPVSESPHAVVHRPSGSAPVIYEEDEDGFDPSDNKYPTLRIVAGSGKLSTMFNVGSLIIGTSVEESESLFGPPDPKGKDAKLLTFIPLALQKSWRENLSQAEIDEGQMTRIFRNRAEVEEVGGTTQWIGRTPPTFKPSASCIMLVEKPEGSESALFQTEIGGKFYCPAVYYASNSAYKAFAQVLYNAAKISLQVPVLGADGQPTKDARGFIVKRRYYPKYPWTFQVKQTVKTRENKNYTVFVPEIRVNVKSETSPELRAYIESILPSSSGVTAVEDPF